MQSNCLLTCHWFRRLLKCFSLSTKRTSNKFIPKISSQISLEIFKHFNLLYLGTSVPLLKKHKDTQLFDQLVKGNKYQSYPNRQRKQPQIIFFSYGKKIKQFLCITEITVNLLSQGMLVQSPINLSITVLLLGSSSSSYIYI